MAGLDPAIHVFAAALKEDVDARVKPGHDEREMEARRVKQQMTLILVRGAPKRQPRLTRSRKI
jgi:hypothetical protein